MEQPADLAAVRACYDRVADSYVDLAVGDLGAHPWLRAALAAFAEDVAGLGPVLDVGCGPGHVCAHLAVLGVRCSPTSPAPWSPAGSCRWLPEQLTAALVSAALEPVAEVRFPAAGTQPPQVLIAARRPLTRS